MKMEDKERRFLFQKYMDMPETELREMLMWPESEYREGIYSLLIEAARSRGLYANKDEIIEAASKSLTAKKEAEQKRAKQPLSPKQRIMFTILPGIAFWYSIFAPEGWDRRRKEATKYQLIGSRYYLSVGLCLVIIIHLFSGKPASPDEILLILFLAILIACISIYLFFQKRKRNDIYNLAASGDGENARRP
jgi:hypothetical protein